MPKEVALAATLIKKEASLLSKQEIKAVIQALRAAMVERELPHLSAAEAALLGRINEGLSPEDHIRLQGLEEKRRSETLTAGEHEELIALLENLELINARRIESLNELAFLKGTTLRKLIKQLGLKRAA